MSTARPSTLIPRDDAPGAPVLVRLVQADALEAALAAAGPGVRAQAATHDFTARPGQMLVASDAEGRPALVLAGVAAGGDPMSLRSVAARLPAGDYALADTAGERGGQGEALAFLLGGYVFDRYKATHGAARPRLVAPAGVDVAEVERIATACALARDMVNTPAADMGPLQIETLAREVAHESGAQVAVTTGEALLEANYPAIHAVGRAASSDRAPRLIELSRAGSGAGADAPRVALIGKGVTFDTGGLDIKPSAGMRNMKKDMGGAAHALALARMVMGADLPVRLNLLLPVAENAISGDAMRPGDVLATRKGLSVEVGNTDAEGRLILADALTRAGEHQPDLTIDLATLTGAARVALGPDVAPFYTDDEALAGEIEAASRAVHDPLWRMPLWAPYDSALDSDVAELKNDADAWAQAGSITAALFLKRFAPPTGAWAHLDIFAWNPRNRPGYPVGGEAQAIRALYQMLCRRYGGAQ